MQIAVLGIDLGKNSCSVVGLDSSGAVIKRRRMRPESIAAFTERLVASTSRRHSPHHKMPRPSPRLFGSLTAPRGPRPSSSKSPHPESL
jgi:predicted NBD/HSP70 family sugar kinase